jgi:multiple sugar transport system permease protein
VTAKSPNLSTASTGADLAQIRSGPIQPAAAVRHAGDTGAHWRRRLAYAVLITYAVLMFIPFGWSVLTSFKTLPDSVKLQIIPTHGFTVDAWTYAWNTLKPPLPVLFLNSALIAGVVTLTNLALGSLGGYAFARLHFPGRELIFLIVLATLMIPDQLRLVPIFVLFTNLGLLHNQLQYVSVMLVAAISATSVFLMRQYFQSLPIELEEAAKLDGAGFFTTFWRVLLPLATPALAAVGILTFQGTWNSFFWPLILLRNQAYWTLPLALVQFRQSGGFSTNWPPLMAVVVMATIPILVLYLFFQRYFVEGVASAAVKG